MKMNLLELEEEFGIDSDTATERKLMKMIIFLQKWAVEAVRVTKELDMYLRRYEELSKISKG